MPANLSDIEKRLWSAADEFRANSNTEKSQDSPCSKEVFCVPPSAFSRTLVEGLRRQGGTIGEDAAEGAHEQGDGSEALLPIYELKDGHGSVHGAVVDDHERAQEVLQFRGRFGSWRAHLVVNSSGVCQQRLPLRFLPGVFPLEMWEDVMDIPAPAEHLRDFNTVCFHAPDLSRSDQNRWPANELQMPLSTPRDMEPHVKST
jgi:hypothetical protein